MLSVAILGAGIGAKHLEGYSVLPESYRVVFICDLDLERASELAAKAPGCQAVTDLDAVLQHPEIDIVGICLPPHLHGPVSAAGDGCRQACHLRKSRSPAVSWKRMELPPRQRNTKQLFVPIFQYRYGRELYRLAALARTRSDRPAAGGNAGKPIGIEAPTYYAVDWRGRWSSEARRGRVGPRDPHPRSGHPVFSVPVTTLSAMLDTRVNPIETEDCAAISMSTESGGLVTSSVTLGSAGDMSRLRLAFENLTAESGRDPYAPGECALGPSWDGGEQEQLAINSALKEIDTELKGRPTGFAGQFDAIARRLAGEQADMVGVEDGVRSIETVAAIYHAARTGNAGHIAARPLATGLRRLGTTGVQSRMTMTLNHPDPVLPARSLGESHCPGAL